MEGRQAFICPAGWFRRHSISCSQLGVTLILQKLVTSSSDHHLGCSVACIFLVLAPAMRCAPKTTLARACDSTWSTLVPWAQAMQGGTPPTCPQKVFKKLLGGEVSMSHSPVLCLLASVPQAPGAGGQLQRAAPRSWPPRRTDRHLVPVSQLPAEAERLRPGEALCPAHQGR